MVSGVCIRPPSIRKTLKFSEPQFPPLSNEDHNTYLPARIAVRTSHVEQLAKHEQLVSPSMLGRPSQSLLMWEEGVATPMGGPLPCPALAPPPSAKPLPHYSAATRW